ncbi:zinc finger protein 879-like isoform X10 [Diorhabda carinulata]|uniref:zinc finger protein 879-like isoform X10 n=1 Tax=Diorhabda carinulata TaxID=1163345 RepID=UPI0025A10098|nr:zinc finger protein 879-like isoform X10 [Diorhabda carinulata]
MDNNNMLKLCRLCLVKDDVNIPIFEEQGDIRQIFLKISSCLPVKVSRDDQLPKKICDGCSYKLDMLYEFWNTSANAEKQLLTWLGEAGMSSQMADGTISAVAQQIKPADAFVKQETIDPPDIHMDDDDDDDEEDKDYMKQEDNSNNVEEPPPKRARRTAAVKAAIALDQNSDDDDDSGEPMTKVEDDSEDSDNEDHEPAFVDVPSTSADDQPGPSGVGKDGVEAPVNIVPEIKLEYDFDSETEWIPKEEKMKKIKLLKKKLKKDRKEMKEKLKKEKKLIKEGTEIKKPKKIGREKKEKKRISEDHPPVGELDEPIICDVCEQTYKNNVAFALHSIVHSEDGKYHCHLCSYRNASKYHIEMHVRAHEGATKYKCEICNKAFTVSTHALEHKYFHTGEKPFQCEICGKHFMFSWFLASHRRTSHYEILTGSPLVKFDCTICNKHYASASGLRRHNLKNHNETGVDTSVLCDICGKQLSSREKLKFHHRTHTGYKPYGCQTCPKHFSKKEQLIEHTRVHTGEKPYVCKYCAKAFTQRTPLRIHERTHTGERPNICPICSKGFISKTALESHIRSCCNNSQILIPETMPLPYHSFYTTNSMTPMTPGSEVSELEHKFSLSDAFLDPRQHVDVIGHITPM